MRNDLQSDLLEMQRHDALTRERLVADGTLFDGYAAEMERVHVANAERLETIVDAHGWPGRSLVGEAAATAAWTIAQHAISLPSFQRRCLERLRQAVSTGEADPAHEAHLVDRICVNEGRPQRFGTMFDWDANGRMSPHPIDTPETVDARRASAGLSPLAEATRRARTNAAAEGQRAPVDHAERKRTIDAWARSVGWRLA